MKYALAAAVFVAGAVAAPADTWEPVKVTTPAAEWTPVPVVKKCTTTSVYVTKEVDGKNKDGWDNYKDVTKTTIYELEKCPETWAPVYTTEKPKETWAPVPEKKCTTTTVYVTKIVDGKNKDGWDNYKEVTKTDTITLDKCPETWAPVTTPAPWVPVVETKKCSSTSTWVTKEIDTAKGWDAYKEVTKTTVIVLEKCPETWAPVVVTPTEKKTPAAETWATASVPVKASSTVWNPVAKFTGAANKESFGMGALAIAAVAAML